MKAASLGNLWGGSFSPNAPQLAGGLFTSQGRFLWIITLIAGIAYLVVLPRVWMPHNKIGGNVGWMDWRLSLMSAFPGIVCIIGGILMRWFTHKYPRSPVHYCP